MWIAPSRDSPDALGIATDLERGLQHLADTYECEWAGVLRDPERRAQFRQYARGQSTEPRKPSARTWVKLAQVAEVPRDGGIAARYGETEIAIFNFASRGEWFASHNLCPHKRQMVLARGILGDASGMPKVACPLHKNTFDLRSGACLTGDLDAIATFPVKIEGDDVLVELPPAEDLCATPPRPAVQDPAA